MKMIVYWSVRNIHDGQPYPFCKEFEYGPTQINEVLAFCADLRANPNCLYIVSTSEGIGADIVRDGKLPSGEPYTWTKRRA